MMKRQSVFSMINLVILMLLTLQVSSKTFDVESPRVNKPLNFVFYDLKTHTKYPEISYITTEVHHQHVSYSTSIPQFSNDKIDRFIFSYTQQIIENFVKLAKQPHHLLKQTTKPSLKISVEVIKFKNNFYSLVFSKRSFINRIENQHNRNVMMIDLATAKFVLASEILKDSKLSQEAISNAMHKKYPDVSKSSIEKIIGHQNSLVGNVYLTNEAFVFIHNFQDDSNCLNGYKELEMPFIALESSITPLWHPKLIVRVVPTVLANPLPKPWPPVSLGGGPRRIALTFDDGPHGTHTITILNILKKYNVKATFFMIGTQVSRFPKIAKMVADAGHEIGNHTWNHEDLRRLSSNDIRYNLNRTNQLIKEVTNVSPKIMRPPYGALNNTVLQSTDLHIIMWTIDPQDWKYRNAQTVYRHVVSRANHGSVVLLHDIFKSSAEATEYIVKYLVENDFEFLTVSQMYGY